MPSPGLLTRNPCLVGKIPMYTHDEFVLNNTTSAYHYSVLKMLRDISPKLNLPTQGALKLLHLIGQRARVGAKRGMGGRCAASFG